MKITNKTVITLNDISKKYILHHEKPTLVENIFSHKIKEEIWALNNVNLEIKQGEKLGIIGNNGSGKSTLLKIITGITSPTTGTIKINGRIAALMSLDAGFHPELTGEENIFLNGMLLGMNKNETKNKLDKIIDFSGLKEVIDTPLFTYSDGMKLRLGFSVAIFSDPDILIIDEVLNTGDQSFQKKSFNKIQDFFQIEKTVLFVSHQLESIKQNCSRVVWLNMGKIEMDGKNNDNVIKNYLAALAKPKNRSLFRKS